MNAGFSVNWRLIFLSPPRPSGREQVLFHAADFKQKQS
jgi:hypothetical protein